MATTHPHNARALPLFATSAGFADTFATTLRRAECHSLQLNTMNIGQDATRQVEQANMLHRPGRRARPWPTNTASVAMALALRHWRSSSGGQRATQKAQRAKVRLNCAVDPKQGFGGASGLRPADTSPPPGLKRRFVKAIERPYQLCAGFALIICPTRLRRLRTERAGGARTART